ncbi:LysR family transcriptional regulator [Actinomycetospora termitidis]|uniref:LysR family transcriptional regulator n=1 Tax=Actinomycetospora termitidis TaxID=3053470 RepID=A0ABT7ME44_9PSEU|nr:LysR family transcriptional regulator [Actinomycetospora sp. Odt1-22]MDL5158444.1 LysR family transcriptional regulator [Actinomycetospora sp. Odt1-22]
MYDLLDLTLFVAVLDEGSITAGAARLPLSLPSASARVRGLESRVGVELLVRGRRGVRPTPAGVAFGRHAREVVAGVRRLDGAVAAYSRPATGRLTLLAGSSAMQRLVPRALVSFLTARPDLDVVTAERRSADQVRVLAEGEADLGVVISDGPVPPEDRLGDDSLVVVGASGVELGDGPVSFAEIAEFPMVGLPVESPLQQTLEANLGDRAPLVRYRGRAVGLTAVVGLAAAGVGLAVVPRHVVDPALGLTVADLRDPWARRTLALRRGARPADGTDVLADHLRGAAEAARASVPPEG